MPTLGCHLEAAVKFGPPSSKHGAAWLLNCVLDYLRGVNGYVCIARPRRGRAGDAFWLALTGPQLGRKPQYLAHLQAHITAVLLVSVVFKTLPVCSQSDSRCLLEKCRNSGHFVSQPLKSDKSCRARAAQVKLASCASQLQHHNNKAKCPACIH